MGYSVAVEFVVQSENTENIHEALTIPKQWNSEWNPSYFMSDYSETEHSETEHSAIGVFQSTKVYLL